MKPSTIGTITAAAALAIALPLAAQAGPDHGPEAPRSGTVLQEQDHDQLMDQWMHDPTRGDHMAGSHMMGDETMDGDHDQLMDRMHDATRDGDGMGARPLRPGGSMRG